MTSKLSLVSLACVVALLWCSVAAAQPSNAAAAEALFQEAMGLLGQKKFAAACPKLAESHRLDPGTGVLLYLGDCYLEVGKTASAWAAYQEALPRAEKENNARRIAAAKQGIALLEPKLRRVAIVVAESARIDGLEIKRDGVRVPPPVWGSAIPVDPGEHVVEASAPGKKTLRRTLSLGDGSPRVSRLEIGPLEDAPQAAPAADSAPVSTGDAGARADGGLTTVQTAGLVVAGVGVAGVVVAAVSGAMVLSERGTIDNECDAATRHCSQAGLDAIDTQDGLGIVNTVAWGVGITGVAVGVVMLLVGGDDGAADTALRPQLGPGVAGMSLHARF